MYLQTASLCQNQSNDCKVVIKIYFDTWTLVYHSHARFFEI